MCWEGAVSKIDFFLCIFVVFFVSVGQVLIRWSARGMNSSGSAFDFLLNDWVKILFALFVYFFAMVSWFFLLSRVSIVKAFPFFGVSFFFVPVMAGFFLGEDVGRGVFIGAVLIFFGVLVSVFFK